jgi:hypothetical protein
MASYSAKDPGSLSQGGEHKMSRVYQRYWERKKLLAQPLPHFPVRRWWDSDGLSEIEEIYFREIEHAPALLDVGAGDLRVMQKLQRAGYRGEYHTQDISAEYNYTYQTLSQIDRTYDAILCLDVLEHLPLEDGLGLIDTLARMLAEGGVLILQTANARCIHNPMSWDMSHLHMYNLADLWAYLTTAGLEVNGHRITFGKKPRSPFKYVGSIFSRFLITRTLHMDYAENIALVARRGLAGGFTKC